MGDQTVALAGDGLPPVDVIELATAILAGGARKETMVSQREVRAFAAATIDFVQLLTTAASAVFLIEQCALRPDSKQLQWSAEQELVRLRDGLKKFNLYDVEERLGKSEN